MSHQRILNRLYWKEAMQMLPLAVVLLVIGFFTNIGFLFNKYPQGHAIVFLGLPLLFAIGIGALLVGQERETKTLGWLRTLPIEPRDLLRCKLLIGFAGLTLVWLVSGLMFVACDWLRGDEIVTRQLISPLTPMMSLLLIFQSLFMLLTGVYLAWRFRSSLFALFLLAPICLIPSFIVQIARGDLLWERDSRWITGFLACGSVIALWTGWRAGIRCLGSQNTTPLRREPLDTYQEVDAVTKASWLVPHRPTNALLWQFLFHNRIVLAASTVLLLAAAVCLLFDEWRGVAPFLATLGASWLSVSVFAGDAQYGSIELLSVRGVSAPSIWLTRQAIPISILAVSAVLYVAILEFLVLPPSGMIDPAVLIVPAALWLVYVSCQWLGQVVNSPIIAALLAPACAFLGISAASFVSLNIGTPIWSIMLVSVVPALTTFGLTRHWMDRRTGLRYWSIHAACLAFCALIPFVSLLSASRLPSMPAATLQELNRQPVHSPLSDKPREFQRLLVRVGSSALCRPNSPDLMDQLREPNKIHELMARAFIARWAPHKDVDTVTYQRCVTRVAELTAMLRVSTLQTHQDKADFAENWLLHELKHPDAPSILEEWYDPVANLLAADEVRRERRKLAVIENWRLWKKQDSVLEFGGYPLYEKIPYLTWRDQIIAKKRVERAFGHLWTLAKGEHDSATTQDSLNAIAKELGYPAENDAVASQWNAESLPGRAYGGEWERQAKLLPRPTADTLEDNHVNE